MKSAARCRHPPHTRESDVATSCALGSDRPGRAGRAGRHGRTVEQSREPLRGHGAAAGPAPAIGAAGLPACPTTSLTRTGSQTTAVDAAATDATWDLRGAVWDHVAPAPISYPIRSDAWTRGCIVGGQVNGNVPEAATRDQWFDGKDGGPRLGGEVFRVTLTGTPGNYVLIRDTVAQDFEDAYDPNGLSPAQTMYLDHVQARYIRDDCIENEGDGSPAGADLRRRASQPVRRLFQRLRGASARCGQRLAERLRGLVADRRRLDDVHPAATPGTALLLGQAGADRALPGHGSAERVAGRARHLEVEQGGRRARHRPQHGVPARHAVLRDLCGPEVAVRHLPQRLAGVDRVRAVRHRRRLPQHAAGGSHAHRRRTGLGQGEGGLAGGQVARQCASHRHARLRTGARAPRRSHRHERDRTSAEGRPPDAAATPGGHLVLGERRPSAHRRATASHARP